MKAQTKASTLTNVPLPISAISPSPSEDTCATLLGIDLPAGPTGTRQRGLIRKRWSTAACP